MTLKKTAVFILFLSIFLKLSGFLRESILAREFGASHLTDGYLLAYTVLTLFMLIVSVGFNNAFLPLYTKYKKSKPGFADTNANAMLNQTTLFFIVLGVALYFVLPVTVPLFDGFMDPVTLNIAVEVGRFYSLVLFLFALTGLLESYLQARYSYVPTHFAKLSGTLGSALAGLFFADTWGIMSFAYGFAAGTLLGVLIQLLGLLQARFPWTPTIRITKNYWHSFTVLFIPSLLNTIVAPINTLIDRLFAAGSVGGAVTYLNNAALLVSIPNTIYITTIGAIIFSLLTDHVGKPKAFQNLITRGIKASLIIFIPMAAGFVIVGDAFIEFIYERGAFNSTDTHWTYLALLLYAPMIITMGIQEVISKALYAMEKSKILLTISVTTIGLNLVLNIFFLKWFGFLGLALSSSLVSLVLLCATAFYLFKQLNAHNVLPLCHALIKMALPAVVMFAVIFFLGKLPLIENSHALVEIFSLSLIGSMVYVACLYLFYKDGFRLMMSFLPKLKRN